MAKQYPDYTPVNDPVSPASAPKQMKVPAKEKPVVYPKDVPVDEPTKKFAKGGSVGSASKRADGCCTKGKTRGKMV